MRNLNGKSASINRRREGSDTELLYSDSFTFTAPPKIKDDDTAVFSHGHLLDARTGLTDILGGT